MSLKHDFLRDNMFVISCAARTGSTMLVHMLRSHPEIICHGEIYTSRGIGTLIGNYSEKRKISELEDELREIYLQRPELFFYKYIFDLQGKAVAGLKFKTDELFNPLYQEVAELLSNDKDIKVVHLFRNDLVAQYVSHHVVLNQTKLTYISKPEERPTITEFEIDTNHFREYWAGVFLREQKSLEHYAEHRGFVLSYEDAAGENINALNELQEFIGVQPRMLAKGTEKIIQRDLADVVTNFPEICELSRELENNRPIKLWSCFAN